MSFRSSWNLGIVGDLFRHQKAPRDDSPKHASSTCQYGQADLNPKAKQNPKRLWLRRLCRASKVLGQLALKTHSPKPKARSGKPKGLRALRVSRLFGVWFRALALGFSRIYRCEQTWLLSLHTAQKQSGYRNVPYKYTQTCSKPTQIKVLKSGKKAPKIGGKLDQFWPAFFDAVKLLVSWPAE